MSSVKQRHIIAAARFELGKVESGEVKERMVERFAHVDMGFARALAEGIGVPAPTAPKAAAQRVLDGWPKEPPNRDTPPASAGVAENDARGGLRRSIELLRLVEAPGAGELKAELDRLGASPAPAALADLAARVRFTARRKLAEAYGCHGIRCEDPASLDAAIMEMIDTPKPVLFDCRVEKAENCFPMIPSGAAHNEMILGKITGDEIGEAGKVLV